MNMILTSPEFKDGATLDSSYQADRDNVSPALAWDNVPAGTKSFAVAMHDPDAPTGGAGWWHWLAFGIPAEARSLPRNAGEASGSLMPAGVVQLFNDRGTRGYMGCLPPVGDPAHRYIFTVYALSAELPEIPADARTSMAGFIINAHCLGKASLTAYYARHTE
ncbi:MAG: YbhB/YbcL family Raf kinase inhibitor-like protein [Neisseria sp.]|nr:YbhB/YbcL family Raf kinase inhibitor-like protein [Neisseria sp.]